MSQKRQSASPDGKLPAVAMSNTSTLENKTGSWKYIRPVYQDQVAPCNATCPVGIDIEGFMNFLREGERQEAYRLVLRENPIPAITGRVCDHPCESVCHRRQFDQGLAVHAVERMLGDLRTAVFRHVLTINHHPLVPNHLFGQRFQHSPPLGHTTFAVPVVANRFLIVIGSLKLRRHIVTGGLRV